MKIIIYPKSRVMKWWGSYDWAVWEDSDGLLPYQLASGTSKTQQLAENEARLYIQQRKEREEAEDHFLEDGFRGRTVIDI